MRVVHCTKVQGVGGAEQHLLALLPALRERGVDVRFLSLDGGLDADRFHRGLEERGVPCVRLPIGGDVSVPLAYRVRRALRSERPDLLHTHMVHADVYGSIAAHALRIPFVSTRHNDDRYLLGPFRYVDRTLMHGVRRILAISDAVRAFHIRAGLPADKLETVHYGLDAGPSIRSELMPAEAGVPDDVPLVLAIGRLIEQKDHATLLRAFSRVHTQAHLAILGWGPLEAKTKALAADLGLSARVHMPGRVEPRDWLARADVFAHTSRWEGFGIALLEAMLNDLPVIATRVSAIPEIVVDGETGLLAEAGDDETIAAHLEALLTDASRRLALGRAGRARALSEFSVARMADRTLEAYRAALAA